MDTAALDLTFASTSTTGANSTNQFVTFTCGQRHFAVDIMLVREIRSWSSAWRPRHPGADR